MTPCPKPDQVSDITGRRFGRLIVIAFSRVSRGRAVWLCKCDCGQQKEVLAPYLTRGRSRSCGCYAAELAGARFMTHGKTKTPTWHSWSSMRRRCRNHTDNSFANYGARGIVVCERWDRSFEAFLADMGEKPAGTSIDRIDVNGNYEPGNCRWATPKQQGRNKRVMRLTADVVIQIKRELSGNISQRLLASRFGVHQVTISKIKRGIIWAETEAA